MELFTITEAASLLKVSRMHLYRLHNRGKLPFVKIGGVTRITRKALEDLLQACSVQHTEYGEKA